MNFVKYFKELIKFRNSYLDNRYEFNNLTLIELLKQNFKPT